MKDYADATGRLAELGGDPELMMLLRNGVKFTRQHAGKRKEFLARYLADLVGRMPQPVPFEALLQELERAAERRQEGRATLLEPVEKVDRTFEIVTYHDHAERKQIAFKTLRNKLSQIHSQKIP